MPKIPCGYAERQSPTPNKASMAQVPKPYRNPLWGAFKNLPGNKEPSLGQVVSCQTISKTGWDSLLRTLQPPTTSESGLKPAMQDPYTHQRLDHHPLPNIPDRKSKSSHEQGKSPCQIARHVPQLLCVRPQSRQDLVSAVGLTRCPFRLARRILCLEGLVLRLNAFPHNLGRRTERAAFKKG